VYFVVEGYYNRTNHNDMYTISANFTRQQVWSCLKTEFSLYCRIRLTDFPFGMRDAWLCQKTWIIFCIQIIDVLQLV